MFHREIFKKVENIKNSPTFCHNSISDNRIP